MKCAVCGKSATTYNKEKQPVCGAHARAKAKAPACPSCGLPMLVRQGKWGAFWGCMAFPMCDGIRKL